MLQQAITIGIFMATGNPYNDPLVIGTDNNNVLYYLLIVFNKCAESFIGIVACIINSKYNTQIIVPTKK